MATTKGKGSDARERAAGGLDFDFPLKEKAESLGQAIAEGGPEALFEEIENLLPEEWREQIRSFPMTAVLLGLGVGVYLGMRKGDLVLAAGSSILSAAAMANVSRALERTKS